MNLIKNSILNTLKEIEKKYDVSIPLAIESGSRGWGFPSLDSDYDCRFIYVNKKDWYLSVLDKKDVIEYSTDKIYDISGWDLKKVMKHIIKSNPVMHEWINSNEIYIKNEAVTSILKNSADYFFNPIASSYHYLNTAINKYKEILDYDYSKIKKYFYVLRPLANIQYIFEYMKIPHMEYEKNLDEIYINKTVKNEIKNLIVIKSNVDESHKIQKNKLLLDYFKNAILSSEHELKTMKFNKNKNYNLIDENFRKIIDLVWSHD